MTLQTEPTILATTAPADQDRGSYVDWPAILGGVVLASAISLVLLTFGTAIGLSFINFHSPSGTVSVWVAIAAASWLLWVQVSAFMAGGYLTGRLRRRFHDASEHEVDVRDGAHGILVWAGGLVIGAIIALGGVGAAANAVGQAVGGAAPAAATLADDADAYLTDSLLRSDTRAATDGARLEAGRILTNAETVPDADKAYLTTLVARETGLAPADAAARVDAVLAEADRLKAEAAAAAETARKTSVLAAFLTAAALLVSAAGAYWAASMGGRHRDEGTTFVTFFRRY
jgi:hypothetical protein